jgi:hypothetical protein
MHEDSYDRQRWFARLVAICALLILAAGSFLVCDLWIERQTDPYIGQQAQYDAADLGTLLFWPGTVILACLCGSFAFVVAGTRKRVILALDGIGLVLVVTPYALTSNSGAFWLAPLRGWQAGTLIAIVLAVNVCAIIGVWRYVVRRGT